MPKEHKKRGRRDEKKRKHDQDDDQGAKRHKKEEDVDHVEDENVAHYEGADEGARAGAVEFYGMLDEDEQEYFKKVDDMLELNQFEGPDERNLFLESVWKEADGKELKIASSQSCSRLLERLILLSTPDQLKNLFQKFSGQ